jgi:iron complex outermembrane receptor protein
MGAAGLTAPAVAQTTPSTAGAAVASAASADDAGTIIVTANKREQNLQDVSVAVSAIGAQRLQEAKVDNLSDVQNLVPSLSFGNDFNIAKIFIRGIGTNISNTGSEPAVAIYTDGAVISRPEAQFASLFDLERVEVLRGPQGTLFGRNAVGGAINLITAKPTQDFSGYANFTAGNYDEFMGEGAVSGPIIDGALYARAAVRVDTHGGYGRNEFTGSDIDDLNKKMGRLELQYDQGGKFQFLLTGVYYNESDRANSVKYGGPTFPNTPSLSPAGAGGFATGSPRNISSEIDPNNRLKTWSITGTADYKASDWLTLRSITNYRKMNQQLLQDIDISSIVNSLATNGKSSTIQNRNPYSRQVSEEFQALINTGKLEAVLGAYYFNEDLGANPNNIGVAPDGRGEPGYIPALTTAGITITNPLNPRYYTAVGDQKVNAWAGFADLTYHLNDNFILKAGLRYSAEDRQLANVGYIIVNAGRGPILNFDFHDKAFFDNFSPKAGIEWHPNNDLMLYYTYSQGFKSGTGELSLSNNPIIGPEKIRSHEAGVKSELLDHTLTMNVAAFYNHLDGLQLDRTTYDPATGFITTFENAALTRAYGVEVDASWRVTNAFRIDISGAYLHSTFGHFLASDPTDPRNIVGSPVYSPTNSDLQGNFTRYSPKWTLNVHPEYNWRMASGGDLRFSGNLAYKSKQYHTEFNDDMLSAPKYALVDANIKYVFPNRSISVEMYVQNMFNKLERAGSFSLSTAREIGVTYLPPRTFGATVGYKF